MVSSLKTNRSKAEVELFRKNYARLTLFENHARGMNFLGKIIIARVSVH